MFVNCLLIIVTHVENCVKEFFLHFIDLFIYMDTVFSSLLIPLYMHVQIVHLI